MPAKPRWFNKLRRIRAAVEALDSPVVDRATIEKLFGVGPRRAQDLLRPLANQQVGTALLAPRARLVEFLAAVEAGKPYQAEERRRRRVREALEEAHVEVAARKVRFAVAPQPGAAIAGLPDTIRLAAGELRITCKDATDLLQQLYQLSRAIAKDFVVFEERITTPGHRP